jgi:hypothetical protein
MYERERTASSFSAHVLFVILYVVNFCAFRHTPSVIYLTKLTGSSLFKRGQLPNSYGYLSLSLANIVVHGSPLPEPIYEHIHLRVHGAHDLRQNL